MKETGVSFTDSMQLIPKKKGSSPFEQQMRNLKIGENNIPLQVDHRNLTRVIDELEI